MTSRSLLIAFVAAGVAACEASTTPPPAGETAGEPTNTSTSSGGTNGTPPGPSSSTTSSSGAPATKIEPTAWGPEHCPAAGAKVGFAVGDSIGDLGLKDCDTGAAASFDELCGASATWIFAAHTHCPTCQATSSFIDEVASAVATKNAAIALAVYDDNGTSCAKWRDVYKLAGLPNVRVYADPEGTVWDKVKSKNYTAASAFLDANRVITSKEHSLAKAAVLSQIDAALAK